MRRARAIAAWAFLISSWATGAVLAAGQAGFATEIDAHPELGIPAAFRVGADSGGAGSASQSIVDRKGFSAVPPSAPDTLLPSIGNSTCESVAGICACVANQGTYCNLSECASTCLKTN